MSNNANMKAEFGYELRNVDHYRRNIRRRLGRTSVFKMLGVGAILVSLMLLGILLFSIFSKGFTAFVQTKIDLPVYIDPEFYNEENPRRSNFNAMVNKSIDSLFPQLTTRSERRAAQELFSSAAKFQVGNLVEENPGMVGSTQNVVISADDSVDVYWKGVIPDRGRLTELQVDLLNQLDQKNLIHIGFNYTFFSHGDSRNPEQAGIWGAVRGSFFVLLITLLLSFPIGVAAALYLEKFAPRNRLSDFVEININNLAAIPSIVFGLLGLAIFLNFFGLPRSTPLVGGLVLTLMTLPTIIISSRSAIKAVPPSIEEAALGVGASRMQAILDHVLPTAMPGILTGTIIGMAQALGETAPLLMIGMVAFIVDLPSGFLDQATVLPVQIYLWSDSPERSFTELTSAAIMVLLCFLFLMNASAIYLRRRFESNH